MSRPGVNLPGGIDINVKAGCGSSLTRAPTSNTFPCSEIDPYMADNSEVVTVYELWETNYRPQLKGRECFIRLVTLVIREVVS